MNWVGPAIAAYCLCAVMLTYAVILRLRCGSWSNPSVVFALFWGMMTLLPVFFVPELEPSIAAVAYITAAVLAFGLPALVFDWRPPLDAVATRYSIRSHSPFLSSNEAPFLLAVTQTAVLGCMMANVAYQGFSLRDFFVDPFAIGCEYLGYRYRGAVKPFVLSQVATILNYVAAALAGLIVTQKRSYVFSAGVVLLCLMPSLYSIAVYADKGTIFLSLALFYGAVVVGRIRNGNTALITWRVIVSVPLVLLVVSGAIGLAMANRLAAVCEDRQTSKLTTEVVASVVTGDSAPPKGEPAEAGPAEGGGLKFYVRSYAFGHLFAFSSWFDHRVNGGETLPDHNEPDPPFRPQWNSPDTPLLYRNPTGPTYGFWTFMALGKYIDPAYFTSLSDGYYEEYFTRRGVIQTNVYTFYRGLINDFTVMGSLAVLMLSGLLFNIVYRRMLLRSFAPLSQTLYIFLAGYLYTSYIISLLIWSSVIASSIGTLLMLAFIEHLDQRGGSLTSAMSRRHWPPGKVREIK